MIGLMYLIFLALMALNVSVVVLESFPLINQSIEETNRNFESKVESVYYDFDQQKSLHDESFVQPYYDEAMYLRGLADSLVNYIRYNRTRMIADNNRISMEEAAELPLEEMQRQDSYSHSSRFWLIENNLDPTDREGGPGTRSYILKEMITDFKLKIDSILSQHEQSINLALDVEGPFHRSDRTMNWQGYTFDRVISVAVATNLNRLITEIRNAEFDAISMLYDLIYAGDFRFDQVVARVVPRSELVYVGGSFEAEVFLAAVDTRQDPEITLQGRPVRVQNGVGRISIPATSPGTQTQRGAITTISPAGVRSREDFTFTYTVERPMATVSADAMNVFYVGVDNPVSISAPGVPSGRLRPNISAGARLRELEDGRYIVNVDDGSLRNVTITVGAMIGNQMTELRDMEFRVREVPDPVAYVAGQRGGRIARQALAAANRVVARVERFDFDMAFEVGSFEMLSVRAGDDVRRYTQINGNEFTPEMIQEINNSRRNQQFIISDIRTREAADGTVRDLGSLTFVID